MNSQSTSGPWALGFTDDKVAFVNAGKIVVCKCDRGGDEGEVLANPRANAHLIAAAPDMKRALTACYHALESYIHGNGSEQLAKECAEAAMTALKKADGK